MVSGRKETKYRFHDQDFYSTIFTTSQNQRNEGESPYKKKSNQNQGPKPIDTGNNDLKCFVFKIVTVVFYSPLLLHCLKQRNSLSW